MKCYKTFILFCQRSTLGEYHSSKCGSNLQMFEHDVLENPGLQISGISSLHRSTAFIFAPGFVANSTINTIFRYIIAAGQITHRIPAIRNWNFLFCWFKSVWLQAKFFKVSHSFDFWFSTKRRQRFLEGILPNQIIWKLDLILLFIVW